MATSLNLGSLAERLTVGNILCLIGTTTVLKYREDLLWFFNNLRSPLRLLSGPENDNLILGNLLVFMKALNSNLVEEWVEKYGKTLQFKGFFGAYHLVTLDLRAVNFVMSQPTIFPKSERNRKNLARVLGNGLLSADVDTHKRQRRIMNPSFGQPQIRALVPVFCEKANQLRDIWLDSISNNPEGVTIDVLQGLSRATLDIIGTTGFGYEFNSLQDGDEDELAKAFAKIFDSDEELTTFIVAREITCQALGIPTEGTRRLDANIAVIQKWDTVIIPILAMNRAKDVWGEDAMDFRPERWDNLPPSVKEMPGVWGHLMTFIHGDQSCIGFRFAVTEMKALIYTLVRSIEFGIDPEIEIEGKTGRVFRALKASDKQDRDSTVREIAAEEGESNAIDLQGGSEPLSLIIEYAVFVLFCHQ
ncbi:hypothetical protein FRC07_004565 [Ceratobasidium sp. 392]|nr:hypothetical protein FRC07_004565 [Ceratobasidium sp. 392]